jgi:hypothetical protein
MIAINNMSAWNRFLYSVLLASFVLNPVQSALLAMNEFRDVPTVAPEEASVSESTPAVTKDTRVYRSSEAAAKTVSDKQYLREEKLQEAVKLASVTAAMSGGGSDGAAGVDKFTGDFQYSIPLMDVDGFPLVLTYNSNVTMTTEASWVGLGWNLDLGQVSRELRGVPDEFNGTQSITRTIKQNTDATKGWKAGPYISYSRRRGSNPLVPSAQLTLLYGNYKNNFVGKGHTFDLGLQSTLGFTDSGEKGLIAVNFGRGYSLDTKGGIGTNRSLSLSAGYGPGNNAKGFGLGIEFGRTTTQSTRSGLSRSLDMSASLGFEDNRDGSKKFSVNNFKPGYSTSTQLSYNTLTSIPRAFINTKSESNMLMINGYVGKEGILGGIGMVGGIFQKFTNETSIISNSFQILQPAFGYLHSGKRAAWSGADNELAVMDFERGTDFDYSEEMKNLAFSVQTPDIFHVSSSDMNGVFRAGRTDYGTYYDAATVSELNKGSELLSGNDIDAVNGGAVLLNKGLQLQLGYATGVQHATTKTDKWATPLEFIPTAQSNGFDPTTYFKAAGELTPNPTDAFSWFNTVNPDYFDVNDDGDQIQPTAYLKNSQSPISASLVNQYSKPVRAASFTPLTVEQLSDPALTDYYKKICSYGFVGSGTAPTMINRNAGSRAGNHISAIEVVSPSGTKLMYGVPVYSIRNSEVSFSCTGRQVDDLTNLVSYAAADASTNNTLGRSKSYDKTEMPAYPSSFLLTSMTSADYVDITLDGPTPDDAGNYYRINYSQDQAARWRFPFTTENKALYNPGFLGSNLDDMASYSYGEKEAWYAHSIESKNYVAEFILKNDRKDAHYAAGENGGIAADAARYLHKIILYSRSDKQINGSAARPLATVEFEYDYELCAGAATNPNPNETGKLTLKKLMMYSGGSREGAKSAYTFDYSDVNPSYNHHNTDAWGNYKPNTSDKPNHLYPYPVQGTAADQYIRAWKLTSIHSPMGATTEITYEADRYSYVQDKRAMRHFELSGMMSMFELLDATQDEDWSLSDLHAEMLSEDSPGLTTTILSAPYGMFYPDRVPNNVVVFKLDAPIPGGIPFNEACSRVKDDYFRTASGEYMKELYFRYYAEIKNGIYDLIPLFTDIYPEAAVINPVTPDLDRLKSIGVLPAISAAGYEYGYVILKPVNQDNIYVKGKDRPVLPVMLHPFQKFGTDFARQNLPDVVFGACEGCDSEMSIDWRMLFGAEMYKAYQDAGYLKRIVPGKSLIRLFEPDNVKYGGNARVSKVRVYDNWASMSGEASNGFSTEVKYSYSNKDKTPTGVSSYEPGAMSDENYFYAWETFYNQVERFPDQRAFHVAPIASSLYPVPVVGYEKVRERDGIGTYGETEYTFHTYKEQKYRTVEKETAIDKSAEVTKRNPLTGKSVDLMGLTQGYFVQTNDFHGKPQEIKTYDPSGNVISRTSYNYYEPGQTIPMIDRKGTVTHEAAGREFDAHTDCRYVEDKSNYLLVGATLGLLLPVLSISAKPTFSINSRERGFYSTTFIKHLNLSAVVKSVETEYLNSKNSAENLLYDYYSGATVLSSLKDEYDDKLYSFSYPSHWAYPALREKQGEAIPSLPGTVTFGSTFTPSGSFQTFLDNYQAGDRIRVSMGSSTYFAYIYQINQSNILLIDDDGALFTHNGAATISADKSNRLNRLTETMQQVTTKNAVSAQSGAFTFPAVNVLSAGALEYKEKKSIHCVRPAEGQEPPTVYNPFRTGASGIPYYSGSFAVQSERNSGHDHGTRFDGSYTSYVPYYVLTGGNWKKAASIPMWRSTGKAIKYTAEGALMQTQDPLRIYSSALYGYNRTLSHLPVAEAVNAEVYQIAFDGFEDYGYMPQNTLDVEPHFSFAGSVGTGVQLSTYFRHSGLSSLRMASGQTASVEKTMPVKTCRDEDEGSGTQVDNDANCKCDPPFLPQQGDYIASVWIKQSAPGASLQIEISGQPAVPVTPGPVIDGWQRVEAAFSIQSATATLTVRLVNNSGDYAYFDDFRLHPFLAGMTTTVYDPATLLPLATHDGYNFTTFYNYDENLNLVRVKAETTEGIRTISETETNIQKSN